MTITTTASQTVISGNNATTVFDFGFVAVSTSDIEVIYTNASGGETTLSPSQYSITLNPVGTGQLWAVGGTVTYPLVGSPIASGTTLTIQRVLPFVQETSIQDQGDFAPQVTEQALDTLCMEIQQVAARTGQYRGTWVTGISYNFADIVVDGINGNNTGNWYSCAQGNTSGTWSTDLAAGDWSLILNLQSISNPGTVAAGGDLTGNYPNPTIAKIQGTVITGTTGTGNVVLSSAIAGLAPLASPVFTGNPTAPTPAIGDNDTSLATSALVQSVASIMGAATNLSAVQASTTTITVTADEMMVGTFLGGGFDKLNTISLTFNGATTGAGGMDTGSIPTSGNLYLYLIAKTDGTKALLGTISGSGATIYAGANMPSGYALSNLVGSYRTDGSAHIIFFKQYGRKIWIATTNALNITSSVPTSFTSVSISGIVPPNAKTISGTFGSPAGSAAGFLGSLAGDSSGTSEIIMSIGYPGATYANFASCDFYSELPLITSQTFYYKAFSNSTQTRADINAYTI